MIGDHLGDLVIVSQTVLHTFPAYVAEFIGTFFLVFTVGLNVSMQNPNAPLSIGSILMVMIFSMGSVSGAHFNPSVTLGIVLGNPCKFTLTDAPIYMIVQVLGGIAGAGISFALTGDKITVKPSDQFSVFLAALAEIIFTMALAFVVLNVATSRDAGNHYYGVAIGFTVISAAYAIGPISGAYLNPAVTLGVFVFSQEEIQSVGVYIVAQIIGSLLAALAFRAVRFSRKAEPTSEVQEEVNECEEGLSHLSIR
ncbi:aquaglyceroporin, putative [Perkinsus marinus ATCC 50983]|uniref:Aquaglyceroporin, putative n=2 Tax=Perkinsus marinus (strain ATCC 50983 / TXsc) TaxID=423536 RepID=C5KCQ5_PERM5|nr:aquaglyceroporin, putative [Perkinsus marinus ATCC 50983]EER17654.1 aquaglyceroporin, putative [Perkinsus marinus ATCC 50983]|eukprot:XP_002785858.1 aquaglyceroporin, putative [Perkinsus marinus ATCC 50983]